MWPVAFWGVAHEFSSGAALISAVGAMYGEQAVSETALVRNLFTPPPMPHELQQHLDPPSTSAAGPHRPKTPLVRTLLAGAPKIVKLCGLPVQTNSPNRFPHTLDHPPPPTFPRLFCP